MEQVKGDSFVQATALLTKIRLDWKGLTTINTLAYYESLYIKDVKSFISLDPVIYKTF